MSAKQDTIALLKDSISNLQENLLDDILTQLDIAELSEETYQLLLTKMKNSNPDLFRTPKLFRIEQIVVKWEPDEVDGFLLENLVFHETLQLNTTFETQSCFS